MPDIATLKNKADKLRKQLAGVDQLTGKNSEREPDAERGRR